MNGWELYFDWLQRRGQLRPDQAAKHMRFAVHLLFCLPPLYEDGDVLLTHPDDHL